MDPINFELSSPLSYAGGGGNLVECNHIELREPTGKVSHTCNAIEGMLKRALMDTVEKLGDELDVEAAKAKRAEKPQDLNADADGMIDLMCTSGVDMSVLTLHFKELFKQVAWMGGEKQITAPRLDEMSHRDLRRMIGAYTVNFILV